MSVLRQMYRCPTRNRHVGDASGVYRVSSWPSIIGCSSTLVKFDAWKGGRIKEQRYLVENHSRSAKSILHNHPSQSQHEILGVSGFRPPVGPHGQKV